MRPAAHHVGRSHEHEHTVFGGMARRLHRRGELADGDAVAEGFFNVFHKRVVVARHRQASLPAESHNGRGIVLRAAVARGLKAFDDLLELLIRPRGDVAVIGAVGRGIAPLALARRVVHERHEAERGRIGQREKKILHPGIGHFTAQVQQVFGPELPGGAATVQRAYGLAEHGDTAFVVVLAHGQGIKNGRDPGRDDLGVMGEKGGHALRPEHFGARDEMLFEVVGVKLHKAGHQVVAFQIDAFRERARAVVERDDAPVADDEGAFDNRVGGDQPGVGEYGFVHGCMLLMKKVTGA